MTEFDHKQLLALTEFNQGFVLTKNSKRLIRQVQADKDQIKLDQISAFLPATSAEQLGNSAFRADYQLKYAYMCGAMANGIHSPRMVVALANAGMLGSLGAGGLTLERVVSGIQEIQSQTQNTFAVNLLHNPSDSEWEMGVVQACIEHKVTVVEASAYINLSPAIVYYRIKGMRQKAGQLVAENRIIAKISRPEVAAHFMSPPPAKIVKKLLKAGLISTEEAELATKMPMADDITVEADSGGHTDSGTLVCIFPEIQRLGSQYQEKYQYSKPFRFGAAGGIGCPEAVAAALQLGADYIVTGSINQACVEADTSDAVKAALCQATTADTIDAPSADMFELGAQVQTLRKGSMYGVRAQKLYNLYKQFDSIEQIPEAERKTLEKTIFHQTFEQVWQDTVAFFQSRSLEHILEQVECNPKKKMVLCFQWYLGQSSKWAIEGDEKRKMDYQVWCGPAMGACNQWLALTPFASPEYRQVAQVGYFLLNCAAFLQRINSIRQVGLVISQALSPAVLASLLNLESKTEAVNEPVSAPSINGEQQTMSDSSHKLDITKSKEYYKKLWEMIPGGAHYNFGGSERSLVVPFKRGKGSRVWDLDDNEHLDLFCKFGALIVGHNNQEYNDILIENMQKLTSVDTFDLEQEVCETLINYIPCAEKVRFSLSGTEAVQNVLRLARGYTGKSKFLRFHGHYHGNADNVIGGRYSGDLDHPEPEQFKGDLLDTKGRFPHTLQDQSFMIPWNDEKALEYVLDQHGHEIAGVLMEPVCMNGGGILPREGYLEKAKVLCEKHNTLLIFDEIITGVRFGLGGVQEILGVTPHLATFAKAFAGGAVPMSAIMGRKDIMDYYTSGKVIHAGTFNGYPLGLAAVKATYQLIEQDPGCYDRMGGYMKQIADLFIKAAHAADMPLVVQGMPTGMVYHSQDHLVERSEGYSGEVKMCDIIIREIAKRYGIQFSPLSRIYSNMMLNQDDVDLFGERIPEAMQNARKIIDVTFPDGVW